MASAKRQHSGPAAARVVIATTAMLSFISFWRAAAIVLNDLGSSAYYVGGIAEQAIGRSAPWFILGVMLFSYAVRAIYLESCAMFTRGGVYRVVKEAMGGTLAKLSVSALMFDYILTGPISGVSAGQYIVGLVARTMTYFGHPWSPSVATVNLAAATVACLITVYFWWRNTQGIHESSDDALRIMQVTTVMVVLLIGWCAATIAMNPRMHRLPPPPTPRNLTFSRDAAGWAPAIAPHALMVRGDDHGEGRLGLTEHPGLLLGFIGILMAFGHSFLAMSGEESLAQVNREIEHPKHRNLMRAGLVIFVYSLVFTSLVSFFAYAIIPDAVRPQYLDNLISGISMYLVGPLSVRLLFQAFIVIVGFLMLAGAINTSIIGANGVLNRVGEDGVMPDWFRAPHRKYGTTHRIVNLIVVLQLVAIVASRGNTYMLGEAYAFGVIWSFALKGFAMLVLRFKDRSPREWKVPLNLHIGHLELPVGVAIVCLLLFLVACVNLVTKQVATVSGILFTASFFLMFWLSERLVARRRAGEHVEVDQFQLEARPDVTNRAVGVRPGNALCIVRDYNALDHLRLAIEGTNTLSRDVVAMTTRVERGPDAGFRDLSQARLFGAREQLLFTRVVAIAEKAGKSVTLLVVPSSDADQAAVLTAARLGASEIILGPSPIASPDEQARKLGREWERLEDRPGHEVHLRVIEPEGQAHEYVLGAHAPDLPPEDVDLIHRLWLDGTRGRNATDVHHRDVVTVALARMERDMSGPDRAGVLTQLRSLGGSTEARQTETGAPAKDMLHNVVVGLLGTEEDMRAVMLAADLNRTAAAHLYLTYPIVVPRNLPLTVPFGPEERIARARLRTLELAVRGAPAAATCRVAPTRSRAYAILETAREVQAAMIVVAVPPGASDDLLDIVQEVGEAAPCEVIVSKRVDRSQDTHAADRRAAGFPVAGRLPLQS